MRAVPIPRWGDVWVCFPPHTHTSLTLCIVNMASASVSEALLLALLLPASLLCSNIFWSDGPRAWPSDRHPHVFVRSLGCDLCLEWTEPLAPQKSCLLGEK